MGPGGFLPRSEVSERVRKLEKKCLGGKGSTTSFTD